MKTEKLKNNGQMNANKKTPIMWHFKPSRKYFKTDALFRQLILKTRPLKCEWCGKTKPPEGLQVCHILPKGTYRKLRYSPENILLCCAGCHLRWHSNPLEAREFIKRYKGEDYYSKLLLADKITPRIDLKLRRIALEQELENLK